ncbi:hypothetical protein [uncultured Roseovarius sp.]|uniref:hypothetical protein n=1 Tax=uncultured Roseovarius sp. TaxID=293344 RepID=UPI000C6A8D6A|nr:hypothetical protein [Roseovarius sp.]MBD12396.1 hypothetical protein [Roseovarius sp.]|tara:strand:+ start:463 stop:864 length:402 start_codon:yes stop_codon:yes gene_type:complete
MSIRLASLTIIGSLGLLAACATPREQCIAGATQDYRSVETAMATAQGNIARGYALHTQTVPYTVTSTCYRNDPSRNIVLPYPCPSTQYRTQTTPVAIDVSEERRKLADYQKMLPQLRKQAQIQVQRCEAQFPE